MGMHRIASLVALSVGCCGVTAGVAIASGTFAAGSDPTDPGPSPAIANRGVAAYSVTQKAAFPAFSRAATASDILPPAAMKIAGNAQVMLGMNPSLARQVSNDRSGATYIIPGTNEVCLLTLPSDTGIASNSCTTSDVAASKGLMLVGYPHSGQASYQVLGVAPGHAKMVKITDISGQTLSTTVSAEGGYSALVSTPPSNVTTTDGIHVVEVRLGAEPNRGRGR